MLRVVTDLIGSVFYSLHFTLQYLLWVTIRACFFPTIWWLAYLCTACMHKPGYVSLCTHWAAVHVPHTGYRVQWWGVRIHISGNPMRLQARVPVLPQANHHLWQLWIRWIVPVSADTRAGKMPGTSRLKAMKKVMHRRWLRIVVVGSGKGGGGLHQRLTADKPELHETHLTI